MNQDITQTLRIGYKASAEQFDPTSLLGYTVLAEHLGVDFDGQYYKAVRATIYDRPEEPVPVYIAASGPLAAKLVGRVGDGFICTSGKKPELYEELIANLEQSAADAGRNPREIDRMIEIKVSYDTDPEAALRACDWWGALALTPEQKMGVEDPLELERLGDG